MLRMSRDSSNELVLAFSCFNRQWSTDAMAWSSSVGTFNHIPPHRWHRWARRRASWNFFHVAKVLFNMEDCVWYEIVWQSARTASLRNSVHQSRGPATPGLCKGRCNSAAIASLQVRCTIFKRPFYPKGQIHLHGHLTPYMSVALTMVVKWPPPDGCILSRLFSFILTSNLLSRAQYFLGQGKITSQQPR